MIFQFGYASAKVTHVEGTLYLLTDVWSGLRRQGHGSRLMEIICNYADANGWTIELYVRQYGTTEGLDNKGLRWFYECFGFEADLSEGLPLHMVRPPREKFTVHNERELERVAETRMRG